MSNELERRDHVVVLREKLALVVTNAEDAARMRTLVIGLDCAAPELVFDQWREELPNFRRVMDYGSWGKLESCIPAITVPAWSSMLVGPLYRGTEVAVT